MKLDSGRAWLAAGAFLLACWTVVVVVFLIWPVLASANEKPVATPEPPSVSSSATQSQSQTQQQNQQQGQQQTAAGGANSLAIEDRTTALAFGTTAPIPASPAECWFPKRKLGRGQSWLWGAAQLSAVLERDEQCIADRVAEREYQLALIRAQAELERERAARIRAESGLSTTVAK